MTLFTQYTVVEFRFYQVYDPVSDHKRCCFDQPRLFCKRITENIYTGRVRKILADRFIVFLIISFSFHFLEDSFSSNTCIYVWCTGHIH